MRHTISTLLLLSLWFVGPTPAFALIFGGTDKKPITGRGWQDGADIVFNVQGRIAYWEGPPFGGGQWRSECRGSTEDFNRVLKNFAEIKSQSKQLIVHDGVGHSFWLNMNREPEKEEISRIDWTFTTWSIENWKRIRELPPRFRSPDVDTKADEPVPQIDVYIGGQIDWAKVVVPDGVTVDDQRMSVHGFSVNDGRVVQGTLIDLTSGEPLLGTIEVRERKAGPDGQPTSSSVASTKTDTAGEWTITKLPAGRLSIVATAPDYADRVLDYLSVDSQPRWSRHDSGMAKSSKVSGQVVDADGKPMSGATVSVGETTADDGENYNTTVPSRYEVDEQGRFIIEGIPKGWATVWPYQAGYIQRGKRHNTLVPASDIILTLERAGEIDVEVSFENLTKRGDERPKGYIVMIEQAPGFETEQRWGGSSNIDEKGKFVFKHVPPGKYVLTGRPNPGSQKETTEPTTVDVKAGETSYVTIDAR